MAYRIGRALSRPLKAFNGCVTNKYDIISKRTYVHFSRTQTHDFELPIDTMPKDIDALMKSDPKTMDYFGSYWYWRIRGESSLMDPESLPKKSYKQLAVDLGMQVVNEPSEHMLGLLELYEYLKSSSFVGPFGTIKNPVLVPSILTERIVGCTGGAGEHEHLPLWFRCREGFLYRCGECDQIFMLVRVLYSLPDGEDPFPVDPDIDDVFNKDIIAKGHFKWNAGDYIRWPVGNATYKQLFLQGKWGNPVPEISASMSDSSDPAHLDKFRPQNSVEK
ncbi:putative cytochrome c oxidase subunit Vb [Babesia bovis T2Bo]|uniref:Cytochrome c oxidase subunit Vb, putative n=1 Tax=Babesia bovis TaxID=5865 RepID=A7AQ15_BABBO|nr:putative cytochrome c oxidase subunit Vb [Babesia bovis T2Bo]EDO08649.1 putative cytochrome c oxidase subunit Vb [Babesia bovis T2Bo]|eukprot:XP_001612217.1 cytochrome c oxidase subunit Vb [Babesia bovis T2Bo]